VLAILLYIAWLPGVYFYRVDRRFGSAWHAVDLLGRGGGTTDCRMRCGALPWQSRRRLRQLQMSLVAQLMCYD